MCNQSNILARLHGQGDVARKLKSTCGETGISFLSFSKHSVCVSVAFSVIVSLIWCCLSIYKLQVCQKPRLRQSIRAKADYVTGCVFLPAHTKSRVRIHTACAWSAWEWSTQSRVSRDACIVSVFPCVRFAPGRHSSRREPSPAFVAVDLVEGMEMSESLSPSSPTRSNARSLGSEAHSAVSSPRGNWLDTPPIFLRGGWCGEHRGGFAPSIASVWGDVGGWWLLAW